MSAGILSKQQMSELVRADVADRTRVFLDTDDPLRYLKDAALDLPLGCEYWEMKGSCRTGRLLRVEDILNKYSLHGRNATTMEGPITLRRKKVYLFKVDCTVNFSEKKIQGKSTARSSIGRLDVLVRLLVDKGTEFDRVPECHEGDLYVEVTPISFDLVVKPGLCLSQLRLFRGGEHLISLTREALLYEEPFPVVDRDGAPLRQMPERSAAETGFPFCLDLTPDPRAKCSGFRARESCPQAVDPSKEAYYDPTEFWEPVYAEEHFIELETDRLYILRSNERLRNYPKTGGPADRRS